MENDRGLDDLFGALDEGEPEGSAAPAEERSGQADSPEPAPAPAVETPAPAGFDVLNAAFFEAATAPVEPLPTDAQPTDAQPVQEPPAETPQPDAPAPAAETPSIFAPPMTRRELRERQRAREDDTEATVAAASGYGAGAADTTTFGDEADEETVLAEAEPVRSAPQVYEPLATPESLPESLPEPLPAVPVAPEAPAQEPVAAPDAAPESPAEAPVDTHPPTEPYVPAFVPEAPGTTEEPAPSVSDAALAALATAPAAAQPAAAPATPAASSAPRQQAGRGFPIRLEPPIGDGGGRRRSLRWLAWFLPLVIVLGGLTAGGWWAWANHEDQIRELLGWELPNDYEGTGNGEEVVVTILPGDFGDDIAITLHEQGVTRSFDAFHDLLLELAEQGQEPSFQPGNYRLQKEMSAQAALDALQDPANRVANQVVIPEGTNYVDTFTILSQQSGIPVEDFWAANADLAQFGLPAEAVSLEGYLFPAQYDLDGSETAVSLVQRLVDETFARLDALGVAPESRNSFLTLASIVQKESGPNPEDPPKIARVFQNRLDQGMLLESDATTTYGTCVWGPLNGRTAPDTCGTVWLNQADIDDTTNPYNTRALGGLPPGPIAMPGQAALDAVAQPAEGSWLFFVAVNLQTGETAFSDTVEEHNAAVDRLYEWCEASDENAAYCA